MRSRSVESALHYGSLLVVAMLLGALVAGLVGAAWGLSIQERLLALAAALAVYLGVALAFSATWPESAQGDVILLASPAIALIAVFLVTTMFAPQPTAGREGELLVLLGGEILAVVLGTAAGTAIGLRVARRRRGA